MGIRWCALFTIVFAFVVVIFTGCGTEDEADYAKYAEYETRPEEEGPGPVIDDYIGEDVEDFLYDLRDAGKARIAVAVEERIEYAKKVLASYGGGYVIVGQVVVDGPVDPQDVTAQMLIMEEGYFAGPVSSLAGLVGFRLHGYTPIDFDLSKAKGERGSAVIVGTVRMTPVPEGELASLRGELILGGNVNPAMADIRLRISDGPGCTPSGGTEARPYWPEPVRPTILPSGEFFAEGFSPAEYLIFFSAERHVDQVHGITFKPGETLDLGTIRLETPKKIKLTYRVSNDPVFDRADEKQEMIDAGTRWRVKGTPDYAWDLEFKQKSGVIVLDWGYGAINIADLGAGELADFVDFDISEVEFLNPRGVEPKDGHVYLLDQQCFPHWILFKFEVEE